MTAPSRKLRPLHLALVVLCVSLLAAPGSYAWQLFVSSGARSSVHRYSPEGVELGVFTVGTSPSGAAGLAFGGTGRELYLAAQDGNAVMRYNGSSGRYSSITSLNMPHGVAFDEIGRMYVSHRSAGKDSGMITLYSDPTNWSTGATLVEAGDNGLNLSRNTSCHTQRNKQKHPLSFALAIVVRN